MGFHDHLRRTFYRRESHRGRHIGEHRHLDFHSRHYSVGNASDVEEGRTGQAGSKRLLIAIAALVAYSVFWNTKQGAFLQQNDGIVTTYKDGRKDILVLQNVSSETSVCRVEIGERSTKDYVSEPDTVSYVNRALLNCR